MVKVLGYDAEDRGFESLLGQPGVSLKQLMGIFFDSGEEYRQGEEYRHERRDFLGQIW